MGLDLKAIEQDWHARGFSFGIWEDRAGANWENYTHESDELFMLVEGEVELEVEGIACRPTPGEEVLIPAQARHSVRNVGATTVRWLYGYKK
ncbi:MAG: cupin domain-containing protein [Planctomycetes bacterium]|nr:cupin domain-containing protein [Planctomycetota bacterium]